MAWRVRSFEAKRTIVGDEAWVGERTQKVWGREGGWGILDSHLRTHTFAEGSWKLKIKWCLLVSSFGCLTYRVACALTNLLGACTMAGLLTDSGFAQTRPSPPMWKRTHAQHVHATQKSRSPDWHYESAPVRTLGVDVSWSKATDSCHHDKIFNFGFYVFLLNMAPNYLHGKREEPSFELLHDLKGWLPTIEPLHTGFEQPWVTKFSYIIRSCLQSSICPSGAVICKNKSLQMFSNEASGSNFHHSSVQWVNQGARPSVKQSGKSKRHWRRSHPCRSGRCGQHQITPAPTHHYSTGSRITWVRDLDAGTKPLFEKCALSIFQMGHFGAGNGSQAPRVQPYILRSTPGKRENGAFLSSK